MTNRLKYKEDIAQYYIEIKNHIIHNQDMKFVTELNEQREETPKIPAPG